MPMISSSSSSRKQVWDGLLKKQPRSVRSWVVHPSRWHPQAAVVVVLAAPSGPAKCWRRSQYDVSPGLDQRPQQEPLPGRRSCLISCSCDRRREQ
jgi:hypothetical protein